MMYHPAIIAQLHQTGKRITIEACSGYLQARLNGETLAMSRRTLCLHEAGYEPVLYFPRTDVRMERLQRVSHKSRCPYKGNASYWSLRANNSSIQNVAWSYENPIPAVNAIKECIAFYQHKIQIIQPPAKTGEKP